jgi:hypothetical protein
MHALAAQRLREVLDAAAYIRRELGPLLGQRRDRHIGMVQVPIVREGDIMVVDALVVLS